MQTIGILTKFGKRPLKASDLPGDCFRLLAETSSNSPLARLFPFGKATGGATFPMSSSARGPFLTRSQLAGLLMRNIGVGVSGSPAHQPTMSAASATTLSPLIPVGSSLAITEAVVQAEIAGYGEVNGGAVLTPVQAVAIEKNRIELDNSLSPYAVVHGVDLALEELGISGIGRLPPSNKNFTTITAAGFDIVRTALGTT